MVRSSLKTMSVPDVLWGEAANHHVYVLNRISTKALKNSTPYEMWTGRKPHLGRIRVFGCVSHMKIAKGHLKKLDDRSKKLVHLGIEKGSKSYRLLDPDTGKLYVSRDVVFEEQKIWNWDGKAQIKAIDGMSFTVEGFDLNAELDFDEEIDEGEIDPELHTPEPYTPQNEYRSPQNEPS